MSDFLPFEINCQFFRQPELLQSSNFPSYIIYFEWIWNMDITKDVFYIPSHATRSVVLTAIS